MLTLLTPEIVKNQRVLMRCDFNVPTEGTLITDDFRLQAALPSLLILQQAQASVVLITHRGNPKPESVDPFLSTKHLIPWFQHHNLPVVFAATIQEAARLQSPNHMVLLENLRFFPGEKGQDPTFAQELASLADIYINDAFGTIHRNDASITLVPQLFSSEHRLIGLLIAHEIKGLDHLINKPEQPFITILGGAKLDDKVPLILNLLERPRTLRMTSCLIGGLPSLAFIKALGHPVGTTQLAASTVEHARHIMELAHKKEVRIDTPSDVMIIEGELGKIPHVCASDAIPPTATVVDIGPATIRQYTYNLASAHTVFANGTMGIFEYPAYQVGTRAILQAVAAVQGYTVLGGGDTSAAAAACGLSTAMSFVSSGGGATLAYLGAIVPFEQLPGLKALISA
jgi:phosphoglycerate kinase